MSSVKARAKDSQSVATYLSFQLDACGKSQRQVAEEAGFAKANIITMFKQGLTKVPPDKAPLLAKAIGVDPALFLRMVLNEYMPELMTVIEKEIGTFTTKNESKILTVIRAATGDEDPAIMTKAQEAALSKAIKSIFAD